MSTEMEDEESAANWTQWVAFEKKFRVPPPNWDKTIDFRSIEYGPLPIYQKI